MTKINFRCQHSTFPKASRNPESFVSLYILMCFDWKKEAENHESNILLLSFSFVVSFVYEVKIWWKLIDLLWHIFQNQIEIIDHSIQ